MDKIINKLVYLGGIYMKKYKRKIALLIVMVFVFSIVMLGIIRMMDTREVNAEEISTACPVSWQNNQKNGPQKDGCKPPSRGQEPSPPALRFV